MGTCAPSDPRSPAGSSPGAGTAAASAPQIACSSATPASDRPTVTSTCSMVRRVQRPDQHQLDQRRHDRAGGHPEGDREHEAEPVGAGARQVAGRPPGARTRRPTRNSPCAKLSTSARPKTSDSPEATRKYSAGQAEPGQRQQDHGAHQCVTSAAADAEQRLGQRGLQQQSRASPVQATWPAASTTASRASRRTTARFCSTSSIGTDSRDPLQHLGHLGHHLRRQPLGRLVDQQQPVVVEQHPADREHLLLAAGERAGPLPAAPVQLREERVDRVVRRGACRAARPAAGSRRR